MAKIDSIYDLSDKALVEIKSWLEPWFQTRGPADVDTGGGGSGIQFGIDNVDSVATPGLEVETTQFVPHTFSQPAALGVDSATAYSLAFNSNLGVLFTGPIDAISNSGNANVSIKSLATTGNNGAMGLLVAVQDTTTAGSDLTQGIQVIATSKSTRNPAAVGISSNATAQNTGEAHALELGADTSGSGKAIGVQIQNGIGVTGASNLPILVLNHLGAAIFQVRDDGSVHIKTGTSVVADL